MIFDWFKNKNLEVQLNEGSAKKFGWGPAWFGAERIDVNLTLRVKAFQGRNGIEQTGVVDQETYRRRLTELEAGATLRKVQVGETIICDDRRIPINWKRVFTYNEDEGLELPSSCYRTVQKKRSPSMFVCHWDATLSSKSCYRILMKRGISVHFSIDNDGTIYQFMNTNHIGWHAGNRKVNNRSIGVEITNAYYPKYQNYYETKGFGSRPIWNNARVHGEVLKPFLGFYPVQIRALQALLEAIHTAYPSIPMQVPSFRNGNMILTATRSVSNGSFKGVVNHYHVTRKKIDCAGLPLDKIVEGVRNK